MAKSLNRLLTDECLGCGEKLIADQFGGFGKYHCCSQCSDKIEWTLRNMKQSGYKAKSKTLIRKDKAQVVRVPQEVEL